jgi:hypothetical protein
LIRPSIALGFYRHIPGPGYAGSVDGSEKTAVSPDTAQLTAQREVGGWGAMERLSEDSHNCSTAPQTPNTAALKREIGRRWSDVELIDIVKEVDLRLNFTDAFRTSANREMLDPALLQRRLLLCLFGIGTNVGLKRVASQQPSVTFEELRYVKRRFVQKDALRAAIAEIVNATFSIRNSAIWGNATTACAADSKKFGAYDQNLMTEWHARYGGRGIMIYWHVDTNSTCIYSQLRRCSSSEVAAMMEGVLRHCTENAVGLLTHAETVPSRFSVTQLFRGGQIPPVCGYNPMWG